MVSPGLEVWACTQSPGLSRRSIRSWLLSDPDLIECGFHVGDQHLCAKAIWRPRPYTYQLIGKCGRRGVCHAIGHKRLGRLARQDISPTRNKLRMWLVPTQLCHDSLSEVYGA